MATSPEYWRDVAAGAAILGAGELATRPVSPTSGADSPPVSPKALTAEEQINQNARRDDYQQYDSYRKDDSARVGGEWDWNRVAPNNGAVPGTEKIVTLVPGTTVDRFGPTRGSYLSPADTPYEARSLPPGTKAEPYTQYEVLKPFVVEQAEIAPAFDEVGQGVQFRIPEVTGRRVSVQDLIDNGYLKPKERK